MIPEKYILGNENTLNEVISKNKKSIVLTKGVDVLAWLEDIEGRLTRNENKLQSVGNILKPVDGIILMKDNKKVEINFYEDNKKISEIIATIKDPEKQMAKIHEFTEFIIFNLLAAAGPDGKKMDHDKRKQIIKNALKKVEEEEKKKEEKVPQTPPKEEKKKS